MSLEAAIVTTYRCNCRCAMCAVWRHPTAPEEEFRPELLQKLPQLSFANVTGGEPFLRDDLDEIVAVLLEKARRVVISTNGYLTGKIVELARRHRRVGIRVSLEGLPAANDELRGIKDGFDHGLRTLLELRGMGIKDIGFGITVSDRNASDLLELYRLAEAMGMEFATAAVHNSYYFHKTDNRIADRERAAAFFEGLAAEMLATRRIKNWFRAYFNYGLANYVRDNPRLLPCGGGEDMFFLDPFGEVRPCNGMDDGSLDNSFGNLNEKTFAEIWNGDKARKVRRQVKDCPKNCWMIGTAAPAMKKHPWRPAFWVFKNKIKRRTRGGYNDGPGGCGRPSRGS